MAVDDEEESNIRVACELQLVELVGRVFSCWTAEQRANTRLTPSRCSPSEVARRMDRGVKYNSMKRCACCLWISKIGRNGVFSSFLVILDGQRDVVRKQFNMYSGRI